MIDPKPAAVRPRVFVPDGTGVALLEDQVAERIAERRPGIVELTGPAGSGKSTVVAHLAALFGNEPFVVLAEAPCETELRDLAIAAIAHLVVCVSPIEPIPCADVEYWALSPWGRDEWIEYLLAVHHDQCASVMRRITADRHARWLSGRPALWQIVLDRMATHEQTDEHASDIKELLRQELHARLGTSAAREAAREFSFQTMVGLEIADILLLWEAIEPDGRSLLRHDPAQTLLAAEYLAASLSVDRLTDVLRVRLPESLIQEAAALMRTDEGCLRLLRSIVVSRDGSLQAMAASLLHAAEVGWTPRPGRAPQLAHAYLSGARWRGTRLVRLDATQADLSGADLSESKLKRITTNRTQLGGICLRDAIVQRWVAFRAVLSDADLSHITANGANFSEADLRDANLEGALLRTCCFHGADLRGARFVRADLTGAKLTHANIEGADFSGADLWQATMNGVALRMAEFAGARFVQSILIGCDLEYMRLPGANFSHAYLSMAHLTGSFMPSANFSSSDLRNTGLAEIEWEGADLRDADLRGATFHMGSSRSGLVGSPIASEGSRTGFYTDDFLDQGFKSPEEIRKANLCGADLRGARIDHVDFYLVDLRGACYTPEQEEQLRRSGAILEARV